MTDNIQYAAGYVSGNLCKEKASLAGIFTTNQSFLEVTYQDATIRSAALGQWDGLIGFSLNQNPSGILIFSCFSKRY